ncbi:MAG: hypothetical protein AAF957_05680 [Planctomycetota bacterium]
MTVRSSLSFLAATVSAFAVGIATPTPPPTTAPALATPPISAPTLPAVPEIDTGGFFLYEPPLADLNTRARDGAAGWTGEQWSSPQWNLVGVAHFTKTGDDYEGSYWLATSDFTSGALQFSKMFRPGAQARSLKVGGPLLYIADPHVATKEMNETEFINYVNDLLGDAATINAANSTPAFKLWKVMEDLQPES